MPFFETVADLTAGRETIARRRYGVIETHAGRLRHVTLKPWPHLLAWREVWPVGDAWRPTGPPDRCRLYYNQPLGHESFLALRYVACTAGASYATFHAALETLNAVAAIKGVDALLCDASNGRLSDRFLRRRGWEPHAPGWRRRNFIRRFYGEYPAQALAAAGLC